jgi:hypothetical protein
MMRLLLLDQTEFVKPGLCGITDDRECPAAVPVRPGPDAGVVGRLYADCAVKLCLESAGFAKA